MAPKITLYFLQASRSIRTAWLLEELGLEYELKFADREGGKAPQWMKDEAGGLGKFPALRDGDVMVFESGNITEYLCDVYDTQHRLLPPLGDPKRYAILQWVHASEATFAGHAIAILYARWFQKDGDVKKTEEGAAANVQNDLKYLEAELGKSEGRFLFGDEVTAADVMMEFIVHFILARGLGTLGGKWERCERYVSDCQSTGSWRKAQARTGHKL